MSADAEREAIALIRQEGAPGRVSNPLRQNPPGHDEENRRSPELRHAGDVLGAGSLLARMRPGAKGLALDQDDARILALLSVAKGAAVSADVLRHIAAANRHWLAGDKALANIRLIFADLPRVADREAAHRVQLAAYVLDHGMPPAHLMKELGYEQIAEKPDALTKYNRDEPRIAAGNGDQSGRWTRDEGIVVAADDHINDKY